MLEFVTILPDKEELLERLREVNNDPFLVEDFYYYIVAGRQNGDMSDCDIADLFRNAVSLYAPKRRSREYQRVWGLIPYLLRAIVDDELVRQCAQVILEIQGGPFPLVVINLERS